MMGSLSAETVIAAGRGALNPEQALALFLEGLQFEPDHPGLLLEISAALVRLNRWGEAYPYAKQATQAVPEDSVAWANLVAICRNTRRIQEAEEAARQAILIDEASPQAHLNLANVQWETGRLDEAKDSLHRAIELDPSLHEAHISLLLLLQAAPVSLHEIITAARRYAELMERPQRTVKHTHTNTPLAFRRLRIGFISPDFSSHAVMYFFEPVLAGLCRDQYEVVCYYTYPEGTGDHVTERAKRYADHFVFLGGKQPEEQARIILADGIDILIDLAGHTAKSGLPVMARKPAPVQVTWLGYPGTTGLSTIDWRITDTVADRDVDELMVDGFSEEALRGVPPLKEQYSEKLAFLPPPFCVYRPCIRNPLNRYMPQYQVWPTPAMDNGYITFGSCNSLAKLTPGVLVLWSKILNTLSTARLLIEGPGFNTQELCDAYRDKCAEFGIPPDRLELLQRDLNNQYLTYHQIDIALDPFPLTGGTTSMDLLWMGVPLVTMRGTSFRSRMGMSGLIAAGFTEWIAKDEEEYIEIAVKLASDIPALNARRLQQRQKIEASPLMDESRFAHLFGEALRQMWLKWCAAQVTPDNSSGQFQQWLQERPQVQPAEPLVFMVPRERLSLSDARKRLGELFASVTDESGWQEVVGLARLILESIPKEPVALAALAEAEYAHGNLQAAIAYLSHAVDVAPQNIPFYQRLIHWHREAGNEQAVETIIRLMQQRGAGTGLA